MGQRGLLIIILCVAIIGMAFFTSWGNLEDAKPLGLALDFNEPADFVNSLVIAGPLLILLAIMIKARPLILLLLASLTVGPFVWIVGNFLYTSLTSEFAIGGDRLWVLRLLSIFFWIHFGLAILLLLLAALEARHSSTVEEEEASPEIQSI